MKRNLTNVVLLALLLLTMSFHLLPGLLHEVLGTAWLLVIIWHLALNRAWFSSLCKGRRSAGRIFSALVNFLLVGSVITVVLTGMFISNHLFKGWFGMELARNITVHQLHASFSYLSMILAGVHLGLHWQGLWQRFLRWLSLDKNSRQICMVSRLSAAIIIVGGVYGSFLDRVGDRLFMKHIFATEATNLPPGIFPLLLLGIIGLYTCMGYGLQKFFQRK